MSTPAESAHGAEAGRATGSRRPWTFLSNHGHVLVFVSRHPDARIRDVAEAVGITERAAQSILSELEGAGYVSKEKVGRRNHYRVHEHVPFRHPAESSHAVGELLRIFQQSPGEAVR